MVEKSTLRRNIKVFRPIVESALSYLKSWGIKLVEELDHIHICVSKETGKMILLIHLYDNFIGTDYKIHHPNRDNRNIMVWQTDEGLFLKTLRIFNFDSQNHKDRISVDSEEIGLREFIYVDIVLRDQKIEACHKMIRVHKRGYDLIYSEVEEN